LSPNCAINIAKH